jgi:integrase
VPKSISGIRDVSISQRLANILLDHQEVVDNVYTKSAYYRANNLMIPNTRGNPVWYDEIAESKNKAIEALGLPPCHNHHMRKIYSTHLTLNLFAKKRYMPQIVSQALGHSDIKLAMEVYTKAIGTDLTSAVIDYYPEDEEEEEAWILNG